MYGAFFINMRLNGTGIVVWAPHTQQTVSKNALYD